MNYYLKYNRGHLNERNILYANSSPPSSFTLNDFSLFILIFLFIFISIKSYTSHVFYFILIDLFFIHSNYYNYSYIFVLDIPLLHADQNEL